MATAKVQEGIALIDTMTDEELNRLIDFIRVEIKDRARRKANQVRATLEVGTKVQYVGNLKPKYLIGLTGEIVEFKDSRVVVKLDHGPVGKFTTGRLLSNPASLKVLS